MWASNSDGRSLARTITLLGSILVALGERPRRNEFLSMASSLQLGLLTQPRGQTMYVSLRMERNMSGLLTIVTGIFRQVPYVGNTYTY